MLAAIKPVIAKQLTWLELTHQTARASAFYNIWRRIDFAVHLTAVKELRLHSWKLKDEDMFSFLGMPHLDKLTVWDFDLKQSWARQPCRWQELSCGEITPEAMASVECELAHWGPAAVVLQLRTPSAVRQAVASIATSSWRGWGETVVKLDLPYWNRAVSGQLFIEATPLLASAKHLQVYCEQLTTHVMPVLQQHLTDKTAAGSPPVTLDLYGTHELSGTESPRADHLQVSDLSSLANSMPPGSTLSLSNMLLDVQAVAQLCHTVKSSIRMQVNESGFAEGFTHAAGRSAPVTTQQLQAALEQTGQQVAGVDIFQYEMMGKFRTQWDYTPPDREVRLLVGSVHATHDAVLDWKKEQEMIEAHLAAGYTFRNRETCKYISMLEDAYSILLKQQCVSTSGDMATLPMSCSDEELMTGAGVEPANSDEDGGWLLDDMMSTGVCRVLGTALALGVFVVWVLLHASLRLYTHWLQRPQHMQV